MKGKLSVGCWQMRNTQLAMIIQVDAHQSFPVRGRIGERWKTGTLWDAQGAHFEDSQYDLVERVSDIKDPLSCC